MELNRQLTEICYQLNEAGFRFVVAGGYARDLACGATPKDADVCVYGFTGYGLPQGMREWAEEVGLKVRDIPSYHEKEDTDFDRRLDGVAKVGDVDIIFYREMPSWQGIVNEFDFNINQFYVPSSIPLEGYPYNPVFNDFSVEYGGVSNLSWLVPVRQDYSDNRHGYMLAKHAVLRDKLELWAERFGCAKMPVSPTGSRLYLDGSGVCQLEFVSKI